MAKVLEMPRSVQCRMCEDSFIPLPGYDWKSPDWDMCGFCRMFREKLFEKREAQRIARTELELPRRINFTWIGLCILACAAFWAFVLTVGPDVWEWVTR